MVVKKAWFFPITLCLLTIFAWFFYWKLLLPPYQTFSDTAKFADIARHFVSGRGFGASFAFFRKEFLEIRGLLPTGIPPFFPFLLALSFKIFGINDLTVILTSGIFYLAGAVAIYFLGKKIFGELVGILAALAFIFDPAMLDYATSGASESLFIFEIILAALLFYLNTKKSLFFGFLVLFALYFTRPSAIIYIAGFVLLFILLRFKKKTQILKACGIAIVIWLLAETILAKFAGRFFLYSPLAGFLGGTAAFSPITASTTYLRGGGVALVAGLKPFLSKFFYNLYNFYKLLPQILSPYLAGFYILSLFRWEKAREKRIFRFIILFLVLVTFAASAAFLPIYRYLHPVVPFIYLLAVEMLVWIVKEISKSEFLISKQTLMLKSQNSKKKGLGFRISNLGFDKNKATAIIATGLIFVFVIGQTIGKIFLDSRFIRAHTNQGKPPVYVQLSWILRENTKADDLIITNLDTWGSWYGERKTIWYPLEPSQLIPEEEKELKIDAIYLTSHKMDDENYYMGESWRQIFYHPEKLENPFFAKNFVFKQKFEIKPEETYEKEEATAVLLIRK